MTSSIEYRVTAAALLLTALAGTAGAGLPLICVPLVVDESAEFLPWAGGGHWNAPDQRYDVAALPDDVLSLLDSDAPLLERMENLRRAAIYAREDRTAAQRLLEALLARVPAEPGTQDVLALFDAGYLIEAYRQANMMDRQDRYAVLARDKAPLDGYALARTALELSGRNAEIELALSRMTLDAAASAEHRRRALAGAAPTSLLAANLR